MVLHKLTQVLQFDTRGVALLGGISEQVIASVESMAKAGGGEERKSSLASGWTVQADTASTPETSDEAVLASNQAATASDPRDADAAGGVGAAGDSHDDDVLGEGEQGGEEQLSNAALVLLGVFGGVYLLYAWTWLSWAQFYSTQNPSAAGAGGALGAALQQIVYWAAPLAPIMWFLTALIMNRGSGFRKTLLWIIIGAVVLVPLPFFSGAGGN